jgi:tetratricopeptide (TPR) repeat protein
VAYGYSLAPDGSYQYPSCEAEFNLYNFHRQQQVDQLADLLRSNNRSKSRVIKLFGNPASGRQYLLRSAAYQASQRGMRVDVEPLSLDGYEPDTHVETLLRFLSSRANGEASQKLSQLAERTKLEAKVNGLNFLFLSVGIKCELTVAELIRLLDRQIQTAGPQKSSRAKLQDFLKRITKDRRLVLHLRDAHTADVSLVQRLLEETEINTNLFLALSYPIGNPGIAKLRMDHFQVFMTPWTREEMEIAFARRFGLDAVPSDFFDVVWTFSPVKLSREVFAQIVLRLVRNEWLAPDTNGTWKIVSGWDSNPEVVEEFSRDLLDPLLDIRKTLTGAGTPDERIQKLFSFLDIAALCDPTIPIKPLLEMIGVTEGEIDEFIDFVNSSLKAGEPDGILDDLGYHNQGFPPTQLLYRFRNPLLAAATVMMRSPANELALRTFRFLERTLRPDTRTIAKLFLRLAERAGVEESQVLSKLLSYWTSAGDGDVLANAVTTELQIGAISPEFLWLLIKKSENRWPLIIRLAIIEAYGRQPGGVAIDIRVDYLLTLGWARYDLGQYEAAIEAARESIALDSAEPAQPSWNEKARAHTLLGLAETDLGHLRAAEGWLESAKDLVTAHFPLDDPQVASALNNLAFLYHKQGKSEDARPLYQRAIEIREKAQDPDHYDLAWNLNNLALLYHEQGKYKDAEPLNLRALAIREKLGSNHPDVAVSLLNLASGYINQGKYESAEPLLERARTIQEKALGPDHAHLAATINRLAILFSSQGKLDRAEPLRQYALAIYEKALGPDHPNVASTLNNLAEIYSSQGKDKEAEPLRQRALAVYEKALGPDHLDVAWTLNNLALLYLREARYEEAEQFYRRALATYEKALGPDHLDVAWTLNNLGVLYHDQGRYEDAEPTFQRALAIYEKAALGPDDAQFAWTLKNLASLHHNQSKYEIAEPLYQRALVAFEKALGLDHPDVASILNDLAFLYYSQGNYSEAKLLCARALAIYENRLGIDHPATISVRSDLDRITLAGGPDT